jgi:hypothetical protein
MTDHKLFWTVTEPQQRSGHLLAAARRHCRRNISGDSHEG